MKWMALDDSIIHDIQVPFIPIDDISSSVPLFANEPVEFTAECEINTDLLNEMIGGPDLSHSDDMTGYVVEGQLPYQVQARRHKKKRINKKWAKRYGYITKFKTVRLTDVHFIPGTNEFTCNVEGLYDSKRIP